MTAGATRDRSGLLLLAAAIACALAIYVPALRYDLVNQDDPWLVRDNTLLQHLDGASLHAMFLDGSRATRIALGAEYLPVRDLSIAIDYAVWGAWFPGFHLTNLLLYLAAIVLWYAALRGFGIEAAVCGTAMLLWAVHPSHAESVAWLSERKGLLGAAFSGAAALGYARYRAGRSAGFLALAVACTLAAVWSKALAAFAIAALAPLELVMPAPRASARRSIAGLAALAAAGAAAFVPVVLVASTTAVIGGASAVPGGRIAAVLGVHGFDLEQAALARPSAMSYAIAQLGPTTLEIGLGVLGLLAALAALVRGPRVLRVAAVLWLAGWLPASQIVGLRLVAVADRYLLLPTLGAALAIGYVLSKIAHPRVRALAAAAIVLASTARAFDARANWASSRALWGRAVESDPLDGDAWSFYVEALLDDGDRAAARAAIDRGMQVVDSPRLVLRAALLERDAGPEHAAAALALMRRAAEAGEPRAMGNLALMELAAGQVDDGLRWARRAVTIAPWYANGERAAGRLALAAQLPDEAYVRFSAAFALEPNNIDNRFNLGLVLVALHRNAEARPHLVACLADPRLAARASQLLADLR